MAQPDIKGSYLHWDSISPEAERLHQESIDYLIRIWPSIRDRKADSQTWGDEVESQLVKFDAPAREVHLSLKQDEVLAKVGNRDDVGLFQPEYGRYMVESTPTIPYGSSPSALTKVENNLRTRRKTIQSYLGDDEALLTLSLFPLLHLKELRKAIRAPLDRNDSEVYTEVTASGKYVAGRINIKARRNKPVDIEVPVFQDTHTSKSTKILLEDTIFGAGGCGLQATFQTETLEDAQFLHDQLAVIGPIMLALTASTPIYKGTLADTDARWDQVAGAVDDRQVHEASGHGYHKLKSRWSLCPMYLGPLDPLDGIDHYLDPHTEQQNRQIRDLLVSEGMDPVMASYFATLHARDPLYLHSQDHTVDSVTPEDVHRSICASVWSHVRLKVPEPEEEQGWRVEFRPMEVQPCDFENAAMLVFLSLLKQALGWDRSSSSRQTARQWYIPLTAVEENMSRAHSNNAVLTEKFWWPTRGPSPGKIELTVDEIINGTSEGSDGLIPLVESYLNHVRLDDSIPEADSKSHMEQVQKYIDFVRRRARGEVPTPAQWIRGMVSKHRDYKQDSMISQSVCYDLMRAFQERGRG
ncbi:GCS-domain-containing protein [Eremomyces bilateralis CBS 781.70]|uniref:Glutamate--cysteine ligase n=1 Tax=Eremomyces bilateralis CBS 781.70 TaxID=1392243 RepID=A0A6G1G1J4_9PEZI|nr:GCS-domain-containing protein [Eremomyces bilateralis CBS 781.70]KAF1811924.1 GCS-domain-containing protein [Eremomyces bilateralis CBS 781.70]